MSFSVQPSEVIGIADRVRRALDDTLDRANALRDAVGSVSDALADLKPAHAAFEEIARPRVELSRGIVSRGRAVVATLREIVLTYVAADDEMASSTSRTDAETGLFDPMRFSGERR
ncbi:MULTISPECIES: hypothetical protein [Microbacterium]|uniref:hypothetical protein n=1 Tax=Microbacterium TaxID=33882 RepID=UPI002784DD82|nr:MULTISPECIES: hypothetical protein [Microbacterium]MDQ1083823.1 hypothetical protein [Microbacterium sp. SORGH_AS_0344]MDQ1170898.1 hypothetical protein [Microbacterium proteolyticum]